MSDTFDITYEDAFVIKLSLALFKQTCEQRLNGEEPLSVADRSKLIDMIKQCDETTSKLFHIFE